MTCTKRSSNATRRTTSATGRAWSGTRCRSSGRRGLSEAELLELLGAGGEPLPRAHWSPLYLAAEQSLVSRSGLVGFFHDYLRRAVRDRYLPGDAAQQAAHLRLADYFEARDLGARKVDELPWQLAQAQAWPRPYDLLADLAFLRAGWVADSYEAPAYWAQVEGNSPLRMVDAYRPVLEAPAGHAPDDVWKVGHLLRVTGHPAEALSLAHYLVEHYRQTSEARRLAASRPGG